MNRFTSRSASWRNASAAGSGVGRLPWAMAECAYAASGVEPSLVPTPEAMPARMSVSAITFFML